MIDQMLLMDRMQMLRARALLLRYYLTRHRIARAQAELKEDVTRSILAASDILLRLEPLLISWVDGLYKDSEIIDSTRYGIFEIYRAVVIVSPKPLGFCFLD